MSWMREDGVKSTICEVMVYGSLDVTGAAKWCREHRFRGNGVQATICCGCEKMVQGAPFVR